MVLIGAFSAEHQTQDLASTPKLFSQSLCLVFLFLLKFQKCIYYCVCMHVHMHEGGGELCGASSLQDSYEGLWIELWAPS